MEIGDKTPVKATVAARQLWNDTGMVLDEKHTYRLSAAGEWTDWYISCGPAGYASPNVVLRLAERLRRAPSQQWFALIGAIDQDPSTQFLIGTGCDYRPPRTGKLTCFANDVPGFYWNNSGDVQLTIERVA